MKTEQYDLPTIEELKREQIEVEAQNDLLRAKKANYGLKEELVSEELRAKRANAALRNDIDKIERVEHVRIELERERVETKRVKAELERERVEVKAEAELELATHVAEVKRLRALKCSKLHCDGLHCVEEHCTGHAGYVWAVWVFIALWLLTVLVLWN